MKTAQINPKHPGPVTSRFRFCGLLFFAPLAAFALHPAIGDLANLDHLTASYQSQGLKIHRVDRAGTAWETGGDLANFRNLPLDATAVAQGTNGQDAQAVERITWDGPGGFSIALEEPGESDTGAADAANDTLESLQALTDGSPHLILSWQGGLADDAGRYQLAVLGRKLELKGTHNGMEVDDSEVGWGVKLAGGWRFGDAFAALSVILGDGIDSLLLKRFGSDVAVTPSGRAKTLESLSILPSLNYSLGEGSDLHLTLGHYQSRDGEDIEGVETLDTINLGYTWSPWLSTKFGVEVVEKDYQGALGDEDSTEIKFGAEKQF